MCSISRYKAKHDDPRGYKFLRMLRHKTLQITVIPYYTAELTFQSHYKTAPDQQDANNMQKLPLKLWFLLSIQYL